MQSLIKSLFFDLALFRALPLFTWAALTVSKYKAVITLLLGGEKTWIVVGGRRIYCRSISDLGTTVSSLSDEYHHLKKILRDPLNVVVDVGANIGQFSNAIRYWYPQANIVAIEADPHTYARLQENTGNAAVRTVNLAISDKRESVEFFRGALSVTSGMIKTSDDQTCITVDADTLDSVLATVQKIDLLKIDVEGAELKVIQGAKASLRASSYLLLEVSFDRNTSGVTNLAVLAAVRDICPNASIIHTGRKLGWGADVLAQDFLIKLDALNATAREV